MSFYSYVFFIEGVPSYVGKGKHTRSGNAERCMKHFRAEPKSEWEQALAKAVCANHQVEILVQDHSSEEQAFADEVRLIALHGRRDKQTGTLYNKTDGGDGAAGTVYSTETLSRMRQQTTARWQDPVARSRLIDGVRKAMNTPEMKAMVSATHAGKKASLETRQRMSAAHFGKQKSLETRMRMSEARLRLYAQRKNPT